MMPRCLAIGRFGNRVVAAGRRPHRATAVLVMSEVIVTSQPAASQCTIKRQRIGKIEVLSVAGVVDMLTASQLEEAIAAAAKDSPQGVIVDLGAVDFLASAGMGILVAARDELPTSVQLAVVADGPATSRPLKLVGIAEVVGLHATLDEALAALTA
jgi:anti-sigma B factor antagonist